MWRRFTLGFLVLGACKEKLNGWGFRPGARLSARTEGAGSATILTGIKDRDLGPCFFVRNEDGRYLCLPVQSAMFSDAGCQTPVYASTDCAESAPPSYVTVAAYDDLAQSCGDLHPSATGIEVRPVQGAIAVDRIYQRLVGGGCTQATQRTYTVYALGSAVPSTRPVSGTLHSDRRGGLLFDYVDADDGSQWPFGARDEVWGPCNFVSLPGGGDDEVWCGPRTTALTYPPGQIAFFDNDACSGEQLGFLYTAHIECLPTVATVYGTANACAQEISFRRIGEPVQRDHVYLKSGASCPQIAANIGLEGGTMAFFTLADAVPNDTFIRAALRTAGERITVRQVLSTGGELLQSVGGFFDRDLGEACASRVFTDGTVRCVPLDAIDPQAFAPTYGDPACTRPVVPSGFSLACAVGPPLYLQAATPDGCATARIDRVRASSDAHPPAVYQRLDNDCLEIGVDSPERYVFLGDDVTASLAELTVVE
jgi:hypothetical protein